MVYCILKLLCNQNYYIKAVFYLVRVLISNAKEIFNLVRVLISNAKEVFNLVKSIYFYL